MKCVSNNEDIINVDYDRHPIPTKEFSELLPQPIESEGGILYAKTVYFKLEDSPVPHKTQVLSVVWVDRHVIEGLKEKCQTSGLKRMILTVL